MFLQLRTSSLDVWNLRRLHEVAAYITWLYPHMAQPDPHIDDCLEMVLLRQATASELQMHDVALNPSISM